MTVFSDVRIDIFSIDLDITPAFDEFNGSAAFFRRQINAKSQLQCREKLTARLL